MATYRPITPAEQQDLVARSRMQSVSTEEILGDFNLFRPAWESGYFKSDLGFAETVQHGASLMLSGVYDFMKHQTRFMGGRVDISDAEEHAKWKEESQALGLQALAELGLGYEAIGEGGKRVIDRVFDDEYSEADGAN